MATLTIRRLDDDVKEALRIRAARAGRSMEDEARTILTRAVRGISGPELVERATALFGVEHGVDMVTLESARGRGRPPVDFGGEDDHAS